MKRLTSLFQKEKPARPSTRPVLKSTREIELMRAAGRVVRRVLDDVGAMVRPGITTQALSDRADVIIAESGGIALFKGVETSGTKIPFPSALCVSVNDEIVHGRPGERVLMEGDIVSVDCGVRLAGYCGDSAMTFAVGEVRPAVRKLLEVTSDSLYAAIDLMRPGVQWSFVAGAIQRMVERAGFSVVREFVGHGIGAGMHEEPKVPHYTDRDSRKTDFVLQPGLVIAVEPMVNMGGREIQCKDPTGWAQSTRDGSWSAHFEHTLAITNSGVDVLTDGR